MGHLKNTVFGWREAKNFFFLTFDTDEETDFYDL